MTTPEEKWIKSKAESTNKKLSFKYKKWKIPALALKKRKLPKIPIKIPFFRLEAKPKKMMAIAYSAVAIGFIMTMFLIVSGTDDTPLYPDPANYYTSQAQAAGMENLVGGELNTLNTQTLNLFIGDSRIHNIYMNDLEIGKDSGLNTSLWITGTDGNTTNYLKCETLIINGLVAPTLEIKNGQAHFLIVTNNVADGNSFSTTTATVSSILFGGTRGALTIPDVSGSDYDRLIINTSAGNSTCGTLTLNNIKSYGAGVIISDFIVGTLRINNSVIGDGTGIDVASFIIRSSVDSSNITLTNNAERAITVQ